MDVEIKTKYGCPPQECVALLLMLGAKIDSLDVNNDTPLQWASSNGKTDTVRLLIECGADTDLRNIKGKTPCDVADNGEIKSLFEEFKRKDSQENKSQLMKNAMDVEK